MSNPTDEQYLGDAVYASFDGYQIWLRTGDGNNQRIALEPRTLAAFEEYVAHLRAPPRSCKQCGVIDGHDEDCEFRSET